MAFVVWIHFMSDSCSLHQGFTQRGAMQIKLRWWASGGNNPELGSRYLSCNCIMHEQVFWMGVRTDPDFWAINTRMQNVRMSGVDPFWNAFEYDVGQ